MPAYIGGDLDTLALKVVTVYPRTRPGTICRRRSAFWC